LHYEGEDGSADPLMSGGASMSKSKNIYISGEGNPDASNPGGQHGVNFSGLDVPTFSHDKE